MSQSAKYTDMWVDPEDDPRQGPDPVGERATLVEYLRVQRLTLQMKCADLSAEQLARRSIEPSTMSLLGLIRHLADVERSWFRQRMAGLDVPRRYRRPEDRDAEFNDAIADDTMVAEAWTSWHEEVAFAEHFVEHASDLDITGSWQGNTVSLRELMVHMIEEYARHNGHADLLRERIDGRTGQ